MAKGSENVVCVAPFVRRGAGLQAREIVVCHDEDAAGRRGRRMLNAVAGIVFYKIECGPDGDEWSEVIATVGEVPEEAA